MQLDQSIFKDKILKVLPVKTGVLYFFKNIVCIEVNEGIHLNLELSKEIFEPINTFYRDVDAIGFLSNRINDFSIEAIDYPKFFEALPKIKLFSVVYYTINNRYNIDIEKQFIENVSFKGFNNLKEGLSYSEKFLSSEQIKTA